MNKLLYLLFITTYCSCIHNSETEKYQNERENVVNVQNEVKEIKIDDVLINGNPSVCIVNNYLIIGDYKSSDKIVHLFDKKTYKYITSTGNLGEGPGEIVSLGYIGADEKNHKFYVTDNGKQKIFSYSLDSVMTNPSYIPEVKTTMNERQFPDRYIYINDTLCIGRIIEPIGNADFRTSLGKWNISTGEIKLMKYNHPEIDKKRINFASSMEKGVYVEVYDYHDLITICGIDGDLKYNIYGPNWDSEKSNQIHYYGDVEFCNDKIIAAYSGGDNFSDEYYPTKFIVFDMAGTYIKTLDVKRMIHHFCYDKESNRIIMSLNDEIEFGYLSLDGLLE